MVEMLEPRINRSGITAEVGTFVDDAVQPQTDPVIFLQEEISTLQTSFSTATAQSEKDALSAEIDTKVHDLAILQLSGTAPLTSSSYTAVEAGHMEAPSGSELVTAPVSMTMGSDRGVDTLSLSSPFDESHVPSPFGTLHFSHPGGTTDQMVLRRYFSEMFNPDPRSSPELTFTVYADRGLTKPVFDVTLRIDRANGKVSVSSAVPRAIERSMLPEGVEAEPAAAFHIAAVKGPNVIIAASSAKDAVIRFAGVHDDGAMSRSTLKGDGLLHTPLLTINTSNQTGDYFLLMTDTSGKDLARENIHWDLNTKQLTLIDGSVWSPPSPMEVEIANAMSNLQMLMTDPGFGDRVLSAAQGSLLTELSHSLPAPFNNLVKNFDDSIRSAHPDWTDEALRQKAIATHGSFSITQAYEALVRNRDDEMGLLRTAHGTYQGIMGDLLKQASSILARIRSGANEAKLRYDFSITVDRYATSLAMAQLSSIGIRLPTPDTFLTAAKSIWDTCIEPLATFQSNANRRMQIETDFVSQGYVKTVDGTWRKPVKEGEVEPDISPEAAAHNLRVIMGSDGIGSIGDRLASYAARYRLSAEFVLKVTGISITKVAAVQNSDAQIGGLSIQPKMTTSEGARIEALATPLDQGPFHVNFQMRPGSSVSQSFTLPEKAMVNVTMPSSPEFATGPFRDSNLTDFELRANYSVEIRDAKGHAVAFSGRDPLSGDSISMALGAGTYTIIVSDTTDYPSISGMTTEEKSKIQVPGWHFDFEAKHFNSANIEGVMSIDGNPKTMPVRMRVAEFDISGQRKTDYSLTEGNDAIKRLDPTKPVWVVIHGREDKDDSGKMLELEQALATSGYQVVMIDWREAAEKNIPQNAGMQGEAWIQAVADWGFKALKDAGVTGSAIRIAGHSWGSLVGYEIAEHFKTENGQGVDTFVALDSAKDPTLKARYDASQVDFTNVSKTSTAMHSSFWGSEGRSMKASHTIEVRSPLQSAIPTYNQTLKHGLAVTTFANLLLLQKIDTTNRIASQFIFSGDKETGTAHDKKWLTVDTVLRQGIEPNDVYVDAIPDAMTGTDPDDWISDVYTYNYLKDLHSYLD